MAAILPQPAESSFEEKLNALQSTPLFMKSLPSEESDDPVIQALQSLAFEGTPDEIAQNFKEQGNDYFKGKRHREAISFYTQGIDAKPSDIVLHEALLCNRAACNLELKNYGSVLRDCSKALTLNTKSSKAYYRSAMALFALERFEESLDCCERCLEYDPDNQGVKSARDRSAKAKAEKSRKESEKQERIHREQREKKLLQVAFKERHLFAVYNPKGSSENPYEPHFDPEDPEGTTLIIPVFFLYPQYATSDVIAHFVEDTTFSTHIYQMFPPQAPAPLWDKAGQYVANTLVVYAITRRKRLLKVGKKMSLRDVCNAAKAKEGEPDDGLELKDGCLTRGRAKLGRGIQADTRQLDTYPHSAMNRGVSTLRSKMHHVHTNVLVTVWRDSQTPYGKTHRKKDIDKGVKLGPHIPVMSVTHKILRSANAPTTSPDETEVSVAQALIDLENNVPELKTELRALQISAAREVDVRGGKKAIVVFVPVPQLKAFHKVQQRLTRELEKKFSDRHVVFVAQRRMLSKPTRNSRVKQKRPRSRTLTNVHEKILEDLVFPTEIVGKRTRVSVDGSKLLKVILDPKDATSLEYKLDSFSSVYRRLTGKDVTFEFPPANQE
ncbi:40S ribosomal protein S7 [Suillus clintonianus]|uniref:40S ribosomal protein S7 n=1 Tax=Suillus clintonianus TaxID=1904413 RepID=UPI001B874FFA|nr:40S ribosomal protein S7 [Suillus clintonianus]KAG2148102.1 40S ribosomal protein S7 [Suillus clintonianus]